MDAGFRGWITLLLPSIHYVFLRMLSTHIYILPCEVQCLLEKCTCLPHCHWAQPCNLLWPMEYEQTSTVTSPSKRLETLHTTVLSLALCFFHQRSKSQVGRAPSACVQKSEDPGCRSQVISRYWINVIKFLKMILIVFCHCSITPFTSPHQYFSALLPSKILEKPLCMNVFLFLHFLSSY